MFIIYAHASRRKYFNKKKKPILTFERGTSSIRITGRFELFLDILIAENRRFNFGIFTLY